MVPFRSSFCAGHAALLPRVLVAGLVAGVAGCGVEKSENPLSPSVAGPIAGVEISAPRAAEPAQGAKVKASQQPIRLMVENANTNGVRPLSYTFEVASDNTFQSQVYARSKVTPGSGTTAIMLEPLVIGKGYYWRARAEDGANAGPYVTAAFEVLPQPELGAPVLVTPIDNQRVTSLRPTLIINAPNRNAAVGPLIYDLQIALDVAISQVISIGRFQEMGAQSTFTPTSDLPPSRQYFWRVRAGDGESTSAWAPTQTFQTPAAPTPPPAPTPTPTPTPTPGGSCAASNGPAIVACISAKYPDKRAPVGSLGQRQANMEFLRDRIIEAGKCGGMDLGRNLKRGGPEISIDFLAWRRADGEMGVDLGFDYDNYGTTLVLYWGEAGLGATYTPYGPVSCQ
jgi:hypothetical protein